MNLRDELAEVFRKYIAEYGLRDVAVSQTAMDLSVAASPFIGRALAAERAVLLEECKRRLSRHWCYLASISCDRSALAEALARARREQKEKDARIVEAAAGCNCAAVGIGVGTLHEPTCGLIRPEDAAAAIRAQED